RLWPLPHYRGSPVAGQQGQPAPPHRGAGDWQATPPAPRRGPRAPSERPSFGDFGRLFLGDQRPDKADEHHDGAGDDFYFVLANSAFSSKDAANGGQRMAD